MATGMNKLQRTVAELEEKAADDRQRADTAENAMHGATKKRAELVRRLECSRTTLLDRDTVDVGTLSCTRLFRVIDKNEGRDVSTTNTAVYLPTVEFSLDRHHWLQRCS